MGEAETITARRSAGDEPVDADADRIEDTYQNQPKTKIALLLASVFLSMFLVALDRTIISTVRFPLEP